MEALHVTVQTEPVRPPSTGPPTNVQKPLRQSQSSLHSSPSCDWAPPSGTAVVAPLLPLVPLVELPLPLDEPGGHSQELKPPSAPQTWRPAQPPGATQAADCPGAQPAVPPSPARGPDPEQAAPISNAAGASQSPRRDPSKDRLSSSRTSLSSPEAVTSRAILVAASRSVNPSRAAIARRRSLDWRGVEWRATRRSRSPAPRSCVRRLWLRRRHRVSSQFARLGARRRARGSR